MNIHEFLAPPSETARRDGPHSKIVMSSRVRLARNLKDVAFPGLGEKGGADPRFGNRSAGG